MSGIDLDDLRRRVNLVELVGRYVELRRIGHEHKGLCPFHVEKTPSFHVVPAKRFYHCFGCGAHGDAIGFVMAIEDLPFREACARLAQWVGLADGAAAPGPEAERRWRDARAARGRELEQREARERRKRQSRALDIWRQARPAAGTEVETYLRECRGIDLDAIGGVPPSLRCHPKLAYWQPDGDAAKLVGHFPAMVGGIQDATGQVVAVHQTYLDWRGRDKADVPSPKKMLGASWGGAVRFAPCRPVLMVAEGIETALSVLSALRLRGADACVWAALSLGNIAGAGLGVGPRHPDFPGDRRRRLPDARPDPEHPGLQLLPIVGEVVILADADTKDPRVGEQLLARAAARWQGPGDQGGRRVRIARPTPGQDFNDMIRYAPGVGGAAGRNEETGAAA